MYDEWLAAGLIFLLILFSYDARAAHADHGIVRRGSACQCALLPASPVPDTQAGIRLLRRQPALSSSRPVGEPESTSSTIKRRVS
jgi:hypothetical protein